MRSLDHPDPLPADRRRPWDDVLADYAARTGHPLWPVTRPDHQRRKTTVLSSDQRAEIADMWAAGHPVERIGQRFGVCPTTVRKWMRRAS